MKIIELLNKIANGEIPQKIKYNNTFYIFNEEEDNYYENETCSINWDYVSLHCLNEEVEILEEEKKMPEKLNIEDDGNTITLFGEKENEWTILDNVDVIICNKINEIIDYLKSKGE